MSHKLYILPNGTTNLKEFDAEGEEISSVIYSFVEILAELENMTHAPVEIIIVEPTLELAEKGIMAAKKYFDD